MATADDGCAQALVAPIIGLFMPPAPASPHLVDGLEQAGWRCSILPAPASGMRLWIDQPLDALLVAPFGGWEEPRSLIALSRAIAGARPLMVLTENQSIDQRLLALDNGADDAICRDDDLREILARLAGLIRRYRHASGQIICADLSINLVDRRVARCGTILHLPLREFDLLANLARAPDRILSRDTLLRAVWKIDFDPGTNRVDVHMSRLRAKLDHGYGWPMLMTERGRGYGLRSCRPVSGDA